MFLLQPRVIIFTLSFFIVFVFILQDDSFRDDR
jgi:hypothetical protein